MELLQKMSSWKRNSSYLDCNPIISWAKKSSQYWRTETISRISEEIQYFSKDIVSSSEQLHNQNVCVAVIFVPIFTLF